MNLVWKLIKISNVEIWSKMKQLTGCFNDANTNDSE